MLEEVCDRFKDYYDLFKPYKSRFKKYDENWVAFFRWANITIYGAMVGAELFTSTFKDYFYYWSCWGTMLTFIALIGVIKSSGATR